MTTPVLDINELVQQQSQPHVVVNEALRRIEALLVRVLSRSNGGPPGNPDEGDSYIVDDATGDWSDFSVDDIAWYHSGAWSNYTPTEGVRVWVSDEDNVVVWDGSSWTVTGGGVTAEDDGTEVIANASAINFGTGLSVADDGDGSVTVDNTVTPADAEDDGTLVVASPTAINYRNNLTVSDDGDGTYTVDASSGSGVDVEDDGSLVISGADPINFGSGLSVADDGDGSVTVTTSGSSGVTGPTSSTDNALARFDGTGGGTIQDSGVLVSDDDELYGHGQRIDFKTSDFTLAASDAGKNLDVATGSEATVTIPNDSNVSLPVGYSVGIVQGDSNAVSVSGESDVTIQSKDDNTSTNGQWSAATLYKRDTDEWVLIGDLA